ncbi:SURF1 family protein [Methylotenera sp.]|uniref:SURF1 family protein n=1 Tax=Methylotenera sp. TaxID=2051956 RepID=UPI002722DC1C|nr:SURF1 family protein [Methylotenera sp.]MDO9234280.1 SURF1 family protein [Methylotenera sp.]MDP2230514.1 SURF1 family protein [Methylotenera sp.]MDP3140305.1 SURF1 family protein [Methylotenera sp.]MDP3308001.1 SURF1 family protein [Methylotenera sp.]MDP3819287.1 SURF1 family protein [Methylotenera sp.]
MSHTGNKFNRETKAMIKPIQFRVNRYIFRPTLMGIVITLICIPLFIKFGLWQYNKAQQKLAIQTAYNHAKVDEAIQFPLNHIKNEQLDIDDWKFKKVAVTGVYDTKYQFLLDNQVEGKRVGFHVITPLKIDHTSRYVLINRGWVLGKDTHTDLPIFNTPVGTQTIIGQIWVPSKKIFTLEAEPMAVNSGKSNSEPWKMVWQNMDIDKYKQLVPFTVSDMAIKLDQNSEAGGFVRNWQVPAERITTHIGYAYQWFGFAFATLLIFIYMSFTKDRHEIKPEINAK